MRKLQTLSARLPLAVVAIFALLTPLAAQAQETPSYAQPAAVSTDETIHGRIASVDGAFTISVNDDRGFIDSVSLHQGTIINPTGLSLSAGMSVTISGYNAGSVFDANEIDTPYSYSGPLPTPVYLGPGYWCPGFAYGYGPSFSLALVFGGGYRFENRPFYGRPWNGHGYFGGYVGHAYGGREYGGHSEVGVRIGIDSARVGESHPGYAHGPSAFAGRSFAGRAYAGQVTHSSPVYTGAAAGERRYTQSYARSNQGFARPSTGGGGFTRAGGGGGFARPSNGGGFARAGGVAHAGGGGSRGGGGRSH